MKDLEIHRTRGFKGKDGPQADRYLVTAKYPLSLRQKSNAYGTSSSLSSLSQQNPRIIIVVQLKKKRTFKLVP